MEKIRIVPGMIFTRWKIIKEVEKTNKDRFYLCVCDCGEQRKVSGGSLKKGDTKSCGCYTRDRMSNRATHRMTDTPIYKCWSSMKRRCSNPNDKNYSRYGGRGIKVCSDWEKSFDKFYKDMGDRPTLQHSIDRIDVNGNYEPFNCRWATDKEQCRNRRNTLKYKDEDSVTASLRLGGSESLIHFRLRRGWSLEKAFTAPFDSSRIKKTPQ